jgi:hypothetical protein
MPLKTGATVISDCRLPSGLSHKEADARRLSPEPGPGPGTPLGATILTPDPRNILPRAETPTKAMFLRVGDKAYEVASFAQASQMFCIARDKTPKVRAILHHLSLLTIAVRPSLTFLIMVGCGRAMLGPSMRCRSMTIGWSDAKPRPNDRRVAHQVSSPCRGVCRPSNAQ